MTYFPEGVFMQRDTVILFTRFGMGHGPESLQQTLALKYLSLTLQSGDLPGKILFYTDGVRLACEGSPVLEQLRQLEQGGVELVLCQTCLVTYGLENAVRAGVVGGMGDILTSLQGAAKVISL
jgi:sulfur relay (sulfurtransferase) complex TusBCD TusD component (DsrE family)